MILGTSKLGKYTVQLALVNKELAEELLAGNKKNYRHINKSRVRQYSREMANGLWQENLEPIQIDEDGVLKNGQHRLMAVIESNAEIVMLIIRGISRSVTAYDLGMNRTISQIAKANGIQLDSSIAGSVSCIMNGFNDTHYGKVELITYYLNHHYDLFDKAKLLSQRGSDHGILKKSAVIAAIYAHLVFHNISDSDMEAFCIIANSGLPSESKISDSPLALRKTLQEGFVKANGERWNARNGCRKEIFETTYQAIYGFIKGNKPKRTYKPDGKGDQIIESVRRVNYEQIPEQESDA